VSRRRQVLVNALAVLIVAAYAVTFAVMLLLALEETAA
jgi:hypothetical protein